METAHPTRKLQERRLVAAMFTDVVAYSQRPESEQLEILRQQSERVIPLFAQYRGRLVNTIGDGCFVLFESVLDAVECAIAVQKETAEIEHPRFLLRIGLHTGDATLMEGDAYGDTINTTSRIMAEACPGGICLSEDIAGQVRARIAWTCNPIGEFHLKHIAQPLRLCLLVSPDQAVAAPNLSRRKRRIRLVTFLSVAGFVSLLGLIWVIIISPSRAKVKENQSEAARLVATSKGYLEKRNPEQIRLAQERLEKALYLDPDNVDANSTLAVSRIINADSSQQSNKEIFTEAYRLAKAALRVNPNCVEALAVEGYLLAVREGNWQLSDQKFHEAIKVDPYNMLVRQWYATTLLAQKKFSDATQQFQYADEKLPYRPMSVLALGFTAYYQGNYKDACTKFQSACEKDNMPRSYVWLGRALTLYGQYPEALEAFGEADKFPENEKFPEQPLSLAYCYARMGSEQRALETLQREEKKFSSPSAYASPSLISKVYCGLSLAAQEESEKDNYLDQAVEWLRKAHEYEDGDLLMLAVDPAYEPLHGRKEYRALLKARNLRLPHEK